MMIKFCWWLFLISLYIYGLVLACLNMIIISWTLYYYVEDIVRVADNIRTNKLGWIL